MTKSQRIAFVVYDGFELLDVAGPASVFSAANHLTGSNVYEISIWSRQSGPVISSSGIALDTRALSPRPIRHLDTMLVPGAGEPALRAAVLDEKLRSWLTRQSAHTRRIGSVCSGAFILASLGLLDGRQAATHWEAAEQLAGLFPAVAVNADALYVVDGKIWTSAGVTTGIDMALAMLERDHGLDIAN